MSELVKWDYNDYKHLFPTLEDFAKAFATKLRSVKVWIRTGKINKSVLDSLKARTFSSRIETKTRIRPFVKYIRTEIDIASRIKNSNAQKKEQMKIFDQQISNGLNLDELSSFYKMKVDSMQTKLRRYYNCSVPEVIQAYLLKSHSSIRELTKNEIEKVNKAVQNYHVITTLSRAVDIEEHAIQLYFMNNFKTSCLSDVRKKIK